MLLTASFGSAALLLAGLIYYIPDPALPGHAPDITLSTLSGEKISLQGLRGRPVLINFWATSCGQCIREIPELIALHRAAKTRGLAIIAVAMPYDRPDHVLALSKAKQLPYPVALDIEGAAAAAFGGVQLTPTFVLIAPDGQIVHRASGALDTEKIQIMVNAMPTAANHTRLPGRSS